MNLTALETLYRMLAAHVPTVGVLVAKASITYEQDDPEATQRQLQALKADQPLLCVAGACAVRLGH
ncbi:MAG: hypothetical protein H7245_03470 [Candidatus Saccharibacteria bacterium]|nr:hypothetical protein [Pseudorhodobacter sp.]